MSCNRPSPSFARLARLLLRPANVITPASDSAKHLGIWSSAAALLFSVAYVVAQLAEWLGWLGSGGGAENSSTPLGLFLLLTPSLFLGPAFLLAMVSLHHVAPADRRVFSHAAVTFAIVYTTLISINYYVQLTWVAPRLASGRIAGMEPFLFVPFDSFLYAVDILGYSFMSVATLFAGLVFSGGAGERTVRRFMVANAMVLPFVALQMFWHWFIWIAAAWALTFPGAMWSLLQAFRRLPAGESRTIASSESR
jgi:hypothetical protein